jgi:hypothetical protein
MAIRTHAPRHVRNRELRDTRKFFLQQLTKRRLDRRETAPQPDRLLRPQPHTRPRRLDPLTAQAGEKKFCHARRESVDGFAFHLDGIAQGEPRKGQPLGRHRDVSSHPTGSLLDGGRAGVRQLAPEQRFESGLAGEQHPRERARPASCRERKNRTPPHWHRDARVAKGPTTRRGRRVPIPHSPFPMPQCPVGFAVQAQKSPGSRRGLRLRNFFALCFFDGLSSSPFSRPTSSSHRSPARSASR